MKRTGPLLAGIMIMCGVAMGVDVTNYIYVTTNVVTTINSNLYDATITTLESSNLFSIVPGGAMYELGTPTFTNGVPYYPTTNTYHATISTDSKTYDEWQLLVASNKWIEFPGYEYYKEIKLYPDYVAITVTQKTGYTILIIPQSRLKNIKVRDTSAITFPYQ